MFRKLYIGLLFTISLSGHAQNRLDSLLSALNGFSEGRKRADLLNEIAWEYYKNNFDRTKKYSLEALRLSRKLSYEAGIGEAYRICGLAYTVTGNFDSAAVNLLAAKDIFMSLKDELRIAMVSNSLGVLYYNNSQYKTSLEHFLECLRCYDLLDNKRQVAQAYNDIGNVHYQLGNYGLAEEQYQNAYNLLQEHPDEELIGLTLNHLGSIYYTQSDFKKSLDFHQRALAIRQEVGKKQDLAITFNNLGDVYEALQDYPRALQNQQEALTLAEEVGNDYSRTYTLIKISNIHCETNTFQQARSALNEALEILEDKEFEHLRMDAYYHMYRLHKKMGNSEAALASHEQYMEQREKIFDKEKNEQIVELQTKYETEKKETENVLLRQNEEFYKTRIRDQMITNIIICIALILAIALIIVLRRSNKKNKQINQQLEEKTVELTKANEALTVQKSVAEQANKELTDAMQKLKVAQAHLVQSEKMASLGQLTAGVAHEINNPVNFIYTGINGLEKNLKRFLEITEAYEKIDLHKNLNVQLLDIQQKKDKIDYQDIKEDIKDLIPAIMEGAERTAQIVKSLQTFSWNSNEEYVNEDVHKGLDSTLLLLSNKIKNKIEVEKKYNAQSGVIRCLPGQLNQVFMNVITNAIQAVDQESGKIVIETSSDEDTLTIIIADNGTGIPDAIRDRLFEPFFTTKPVGQGTGLGLAISYGIIKNHSGKIDIESEQDKGTKVILTLPKK